MDSEDEGHQLGSSDDSDPDQTGLQHDGISACRGSDEPNGYSRRVSRRLSSTKHRSHRTTVQNGVANGTAASARLTPPVAAKRPMRGPILSDSDDDSVPAAVAINGTAANGITAGVIETDRYNIAAAAEPAEEGACRSSADNVKPVKIGSKISTLPAQSKQFAGSAIPTAAAIMAAGGYRAAAAAQQAAEAAAVAQGPQADGKLAAPSPGAPVSRPISLPIPATARRAVGRSSSAAGNTAVAAWDPAFPHEQQQKEQQQGRSWAEEGWSSVKL
eukprot:GHRR01031355.1.p1 GENE.GHRR01031355.1~~GHRR01031355.1.p1  ORF type:complete len:273 (+),score=136.64 GHRR01031355.1:1349-2167(+)